MEDPYELTLRIGARYLGFEGFRALKEDLSHAHEMFQHMAEHTLTKADVFKGVTDIGMMMGTGAAGIGISSMRAAMQVDQAARQMGATYDMSKRRLEDFRKFAEEQSLKLGETQQTLFQALGEASLAGYGDETTQKIATQATKLSYAVKGSLGGITQSVTSTLKAFKVRGDEVVPTIDLIGKAMAKSGQGAALLSGYAARAMQTFAQAKIPLREYLSLSTRIAQINPGRSGYDIAQMGNLVQRLRNPTPRQLEMVGGQQEWNRLVNFRRYGVGGTLQNIMNLSRETGDPSITRALIGGPTQQRVAQEVIQASRGRSPLGGAAGYVNRAYRGAQGSPAMEFRHFKVAVEELQVAIGRGLLPIMTQLMRTINPMVTRWVNWANKNQETVKTLIGVGLAIGGVSVGMRVLHGLIIGAKDAMTLFHGAAKAVKLLQVADESKKAADGFKGIADGLKLVNKEGKVIGEFQTAANGMKAMGTASKAAAAGNLAVGATAETASVGLRAMAVSWIAALGPIGIAIGLAIAVGVGFALLYTHFKQVREAVDAVGKAFGKLAGWMGNLAGEGIKALGHGLGQIGNKFGEIIPLIGKTITKLVANAKHFGINLVKSFIAGIGSMKDKLVEAAKNTILAPVQWAAGFMSPNKYGDDPRKWGQNLSTSFQAGIADKQDDVTKTAHDMVRNIALEHTASVEGRAAGHAYAAGFQDHLDKSRFHANVHFSHTGPGGDGGGQQLPPWKMYKYPYWHGRYGPGSKAGPGKTLGSGGPGGGRPSSPAPTTHPGGTSPHPPRRPGRVITSPSVVQATWTPGKGGVPWHAGAFGAFSDPIGYRSNYPYPAGTFSPALGFTGTVSDIDQLANTHGRQRFRLVGTGSEKWTYERTVQDRDVGKPWTSDPRQGYGHSDPSDFVQVWKTPQGHTVLFMHTGQDGKARVWEKDPKTGKWGFGWQALKQNQQYGGGTWLWGSGLDPQDYSEGGSLNAHLCIITDANGRQDIVSLTYDGQRQYLKAGYKVVRAATYSGAGGGRPVGNRPGGRGAAYARPGGGGRGGGPGGGVGRFRWGSVRPIFAHGYGGPGGGRDGGGRWGAVRPIFAHGGGVGPGRWGSVGPIFAHGVGPGGGGPGGGVGNPVGDPNPIHWEPPAKNPPPRVPKKPPTPGHWTHPGMSDAEWGRLVHAAKLNHMDPATLYGIWVQEGGARSHYGATPTGAAQAGYTYARAAAADYASLLHDTYTAQYAIDYMRNRGYPDTEQGHKDAALALYNGAGHAEGVGPPSDPGAHGHLYVKDVHDFAQRAKWIPPSGHKPKPRHHPRHPGKPPRGPQRWPGEYRGLTRPAKWAMTGYIPANALYSTPFYVPPGPPLVGLQAAQRNTMAWMQFDKQWAKWTFGGMKPSDMLSPSGNVTPLLWTYVHHREREIQEARYLGIEQTLAWWDRVPHTKANKSIYDARMQAIARNTKVQLHEVDAIVKTAPMQYHIDNQNRQIALERLRWQGIDPRYLDHKNKVRWVRDQEDIVHRQRKVMDLQAKMYAATHSTVKGIDKWLKEKIAADARWQRNQDRLLEQKAGVGPAGKAVPVHVIGHCEAETRSEHHRKKTANKAEETARHTQTLVKHAQHHGQLFEKMVDALRHHSALLHSIERALHRGKHVDSPLGGRVVGVQHGGGMPV